MQARLLIKKFALLNRFSNLIHGFSTRKGGFSEPPFHYLNLGLSTPDNTERVKKNRKLFFEALNVKENRLVFPQQVHSANVQVVQKPGIVHQCDALITATRNLFLTIQTADCFPVFIFDPIKQVVAVVHSGWKGTAQNIVGKTIREMQQSFNCQPEDLRIAIGPGIQQSCYQINEQTATYFDHRFLQPDGPGHFKLDILGNIIFQIEEQGVSENQMEWDDTCTHCAVETYYSYRRDGAQSGRMMGIIGMID